MGKKSAPKAPPPPPKQLTSQDLTVSVDTDGIPTETLERRSATKWAKVRAAGEAEKLARAEAKGRLTKKQRAELEKKVKQARADAEASVDAMTPEQQAAYVKDWKKAFIARTKQIGGYDDLVRRLEGAAKGSPKWVDQPLGDPDDVFEKAFAEQKEHYDTWRRPLLNGLGKKLVYDPDWQPETSASFIDAKGKKTYANPETTPYWVTAGYWDDKNKKWVGYRPGTWAKITAPNGKSIFARALDGNGRRGISTTTTEGRQLEGSPALFQGLGYTASGTEGVNVAEDATFHVDVFPGSAGDGALGDLSPAETQEAGALIASGRAKVIAGREDLERIKNPVKKGVDTGDPPKPSPAAQPKSGLLLLEGFPNVFHGRDMRRVGYADAAAIHSGGGHVAQGSPTVFVGKYPLSRVGDATSDGLAIVSGAPDVIVG